MARRSWGVFFGTLHLFGFAVFLEVWHPQWSRDALTVLGFGVSWRQRPLILFHWDRDAMYGTPSVWVEWWGGKHYHWLPRAPEKAA